MSKSQYYVLKAINTKNLGNNHGTAIFKVKLPLGLHYKKWKLSIAVLKTVLKLLKLDQQNEIIKNMSAMISC